MRELDNNRHEIDATVSAYWVKAVVWFLLIPKRYADQRVFGGKLFSTVEFTSLKMVELSVASFSSREIPSLLISESTFVDC